MRFRRRLPRALSGSVAVLAIAALLALGGRAHAPVATADDRPAPAAGEGAPADLATLTCRVAKTEAASKTLGATIVTVEVRNAGRAPAEPVVFSVTGRAVGDDGRAGTRTVRRMPDPVEGRAGRLVPPGGSTTYPLLVPLPARRLAGAQVAVVSASFPPAGTGGTAGVSEPPITVESVSDRAVADEMGVKVSETTVRARNRLAQAVDATFLALCKEPADARLLLAHRFAPGELASFTVREPALALFDAFARRVTGCAIRKLTLVDWSVVSGDGGAAGAALVRAAWAKWRRWDDPFPAVRGRFTLRVAPSGSRAPRVTSGSFALDASGTVAVEGGADLDAEAASAARDGIAEAFADLRRPSADRVVEIARPSLLERARVSRVRCEAPTSGERGPAEVLLVEGDVLRGREDPEAGGAIRETWTIAPHGGDAPDGGYVVTRKALFQASIAGGRAPSDERLYAYGEANGVLVPTRFERAHDYTGTSRSSTTVELTDLHVESREAPSLAVADVAEVRAAWDAVYRYPDDPVDLVARFTVETPATDGVWQGERKVSGRMRLEGFRGYGRGARHWRSAKIELDPSTPERKVASLRDAVEDRLGIWANRDFAGREAYDVAFRGATVTPRPGRAGEFDVKNGPCTGLRLRRGRVVEWEGAGVSTGTFEYDRVGTTSFPVRWRLRDAFVEATVRDLGGGWLVPVRMRLERVFDAAWGPETLVFEGVEVVPTSAK